MLAQFKNKSFQHYLNLAPSQNICAIPQIHIFQPNNIDSDVIPDVSILGLDKIKYDPPLEIADIIDKLVSAKTSGSDDINAAMLGELPKKTYCLSHYANQHGFSFF